MKNFLTITFMLAIVQTVSFGQNNLYPKIDSLILSKMKDNRIVGLSIGVVKDRELFYTKGYGFTSVDSLHKVTEQTVFHTSSITKVFTASAIMQLVERGEIKLTDKLTTHLPDFKMKDKRYLQITIEHLLTHSSGLPWEHNFNNSPNDSTALEQFVSDLKNEKLRFAPGDKFDGSTYSNVAYSILGLIIQRKSGMNYEKYIQKYILAPNKMTNCFFNHKLIKQEIKAEPIILSGESKEIERFNLSGVIKDLNPVLKYPNYALIKRDTYGRTSEHAPNDGLITSANDLSNWMTQLLTIYADSTSQTKQFISYSTLKNMWKLQRSIPDYKTSMGLGWWRYSDSPFGDYVHHPGREPGFSSVIMIYPEKNIGITILCNGMYADQLVWNELPELILNLMNEENNSR
ncbi:serine hydrolase domain-containing protein [Flavobacterium filum]|uniref:serine hydrolase domain-containing protein n=1 Tax=Flavobacterium filum TaxID=370974 RepID=UPI0023F4B0DF|nr:serine hydrolase domain-containing protein [Flavobacterium filum]